jgi:hypothetical protein
MVSNVGTTNVSNQAYTKIATPPLPVVGLAPDPALPHAAGSDQTAPRKTCPDTCKGIMQTSCIDSGDPTLTVKDPQSSNRDYTPPPPPPSFATIAALPPSPKPLELTPTNLAIAAATLELMTAVKKHQANSLSLLRVTTSTGTIMDSKMGLLRKHDISLMLSATIRVQKAGGTCFLLETLYEIARLEEKEARQLFAKEHSVMSAANDTAMAMSSDTDLHGFTTVSRRGGASSSSPPKQ